MYSVIVAVQLVLAVVILVDIVYAWFSSKKDYLIDANSGAVMRGVLGLAFLAEWAFYDGSWIDLTVGLLWLPLAWIRYVDGKRLADSSEG